MYIVGAGGLAKDNGAAVRWLWLATSKGHKPSQALLGHMLFIGDGMAPQRAKGLMWLTIANNGADGPKDAWIRDLYQRDLASASTQDRQAAAAMLQERAKGPPLPSIISRSLIKTLSILRPLGIPMLASTPESQPDQ
jgi:hypothetical protein